MKEEGVWSLSKKSLEKIIHREFTLTNPTRRRIMRQETKPSIRPRVGQRISELLGFEDSELSDNTLENELAAFLKSQNYIEFPSSNNPRVSVIIITYNKAHYAYRCLRSLLIDELPPCELIIVDNGSSDETPELLRRIKNVKLILNTKNQYFSHANNQGAAAAKGDYLFFINQDAFVQKGCTSSLLEILHSRPDAGAAGAKLVSRKGRLLEAGSIIWNDGTCLGYGRGDNPDKPEYCYVRSVDYASAACLMVRREAFLNVEGFSEEFTPAYYEDTDLCMKLWETGFHVTYQPLAVATHVEFSSSSFQNATKLMIEHQRIFVRKHASKLMTKLPYSPKNVLRARDRSARPRLLVIDDCVPSPPDGSGYPRMYLMLKTMAGLGYPLTLLPTDGTPKQPETKSLTQMGIEILWGPTGMKKILAARRDFYDIALISRPQNASYGISLVRGTNPHARIIYDVEALWHRREQGRVKLGLPPMNQRFTDEGKELAIIDKADFVISVSQGEKSVIEKKLNKFVLLWGHAALVSPTETSFEDRTGLLFVGGFKSAPAHNDDAVLHFTQNLLPKIRQKLPDCAFTVAATNAPNYIKRLSSDSTKITEQFVSFYNGTSYPGLKNVRELYELCKVFVAPIRFGAGIMLKLVDAMSVGLPCVVSEVGAEGLGLTDGEEAMVAHDDTEFIEKTIQLYSDSTLWKHIRLRELAFAKENFDPRKMQDRLAEFLELVSIEGGHER